MPIIANFSIRNDGRHFRPWWTGIAVSVSAAIGVIALFGQSFSMEW